MPGRRPERIPAALAWECACLIKTNRINQRLSQLFIVAIAKVAPWKSDAQVQAGFFSLVWD
jgi:hypothetical protein